MHMTLECRLEFMFGLSFNHSRFCSFHCQVPKAAYWAQSKHHNSLRIVYRSTSIVYHQINLEMAHPHTLREKRLALMQISESRGFSYTARRNTLCCGHCWYIYLD